MNNDSKIISCPKCETKNRIRDHSDDKLPVCGKCGAPLEEKSDSPSNQLLTGAKLKIKQWWDKVVDVKATHDEHVVKSIENRNDNIIQSHLKKISTGNHWRYYIENSVRDCINDIAKAEGNSNMAPGHQYLSEWSIRANTQYINLQNYLLELFRNRLSHLEQAEKDDKNKKIRDSFINLKNKYADLIQKFFDVTERKVSILDNYGDENWDELPKQINLVINKIAKREGYTDHNLKEWRKFDFYTPEEFKLLKTELFTEFKKYHEKQNHKNARFDDDSISSMKGDEFETYLSKKIREFGYEISGTPTTGDQGADLIAQKDGKKFVIQAKRYSSPVGNKAVQEVIGALNYYGADQGFVITNTTFTSSAKALAQKGKVVLIDGHDLKTLERYF